MTGKKAYQWKWMLSAAGILLLLFLCAGKVYGAERIRVLVNGETPAVIEKKQEQWYLKADSSSQQEFKGVQYLKIPKNKELESGYYFFLAQGRLDTRKRFHRLRTRVNNKTFIGDYYFGYPNGRLYMKRGWVTVGKEKYWLSSSGRKYTDCWKGGYYLTSSGKIAKNTKTPDGFYVDCDGHKCKKEEMRLSSLKKSINSMIQGYSGTWSVYVKNLKTQDILLINEKQMTPASIIKLFVMASAYDGIKRGTIPNNSNTKRLLQNMITVSDNESYNALVRSHDKSQSFVNGAKKVNQFLKRNGFSKTGVHSTLHPAVSAFVSDGNRNLTTVKDTGTLLEKIYRGTCVSKKASKEMLDLLLKQTRRWKIPSGLPSGTKVANKTGETSQYQHDAAIVFGPKTDYVVCIFSQTNYYWGVQGIKQLSSQIYQALN